jgi:hypothetical protein
MATPGNPAKMKIRPPHENDHGFIPFRRLLALDDVHVVLAGEAVVPAAVARGQPVGSNYQ